MNYDLAIIPASDITGMRTARDFHMTLNETRTKVDIAEITSDLSREGCTELDYSNRNIGDLEIGVLAARFFINRSISTVTLRNNNIGDYGVQVLAALLKDQAEVTRVNLSNNPIGDIGILTLAELEQSRPDIQVFGVNLSDERVNLARKRLSFVHGESDGNEPSIKDDEATNPAGSWISRAFSRSPKRVSR